MALLSKLQIRAKVLSIIADIKSLQYRNDDVLQDLCIKLNEIEDKKTMFDIFIKEYIKLNEDDCTFCACILKNTVPIDYISEKSNELLKSSLSDEYKYKIVQLLRVAGGSYNYSDLSSYFENPDEIIDLETKKLLDSAVFNPESMLDFLDFVAAVSERDKSLLLQSLDNDYKGDMLANIIYPVLYSDFSDEFTMQVIDVLCKAKSSLAIEPFEYLIETSNNEEIVSACKKGLKILKLAGCTKEKADEYFNHTIRDSVPFQYFVTIPDGTGNQAVLATRKHNNNHVSLFATVISDTSGIVDCFGFFDIEQTEIIKIIKKFYVSEGQYSVPKEYVKYILENAQKINIQNKTKYPYEYICWKPMIHDIESLNQSLKDYAEFNCKIQILNQDEASDLMTKEYTYRWFLTPNDNEIINNTIEEIYSLEDVKIDKINKMLIDKVEYIFNNEISNIWKERIYNLIYILRKNDKLKEADNFYTIIKNENLYKLFKQIVVQRSIFNYFVVLKENISESFFSKNIFKKKNTSENKYNEKKINEIIIELKRSWIDK